MIGKPQQYSSPNPTPYSTSPWHSSSDPTAEIFPSPSSLSPVLSTYNSLLTALTKLSVTEFLPPESVESDEFRMYSFKVRGCTRAKAHDWTECPFAHPGEKARRRDPRLYSYSGTACTDFRKGGCPRGDSCDFAHGVFECWLHPTRYRTQPCKDGLSCTRRVCFFAHAPGQLRLESGSDDPFEECSSPLAATLVSNLRLNKVRSMPTGSSSNLVRTGFYSLPTTPTRMVRAGYLDGWKEDPVTQELADPDIGWISELVK